MKTKLDPSSSTRLFPPAPFPNRIPSDLSRPAPSSSLRVPRLEFLEGGAAAQQEAEQLAELLAAHVAVVVQVEQGKPSAGTESIELFKIPGTKMVQKTRKRKKAEIRSYLWLGLSLSNLHLPGFDGGSIGAGALGGGGGGHLRIHVHRLRGGAAKPALGAPDLDSLQTTQLLCGFLARRKGHGPNPSQKTNPTCPIPKIA